MKDKTIKISSKIYQRILKLKKETNLPIKYIVQEAIIRLMADDLKKDMKNPRDLHFDYKQFDFIPPTEEEVNDELIRFEQADIYEVL